MSDDVVAPDGWTIAPLAQCVDVLDSRRKPVNASERAARPGAVPYYGATGQVGWIDGYLFDEELVLLGEDGAPFLDKSKSIAYVIDGKSWINNHAHVLRARPEVTSNRYIKHYLDSFDFTDRVGGSTRDKLTQGSMNTIPVVLAPRQVQDTLVGAIDAVASQRVRALDHLSAAQRAIERFRQAVLAAACSGRLTADWRAQHAVGTGGQLIEQVTEERRTHLGRRFKDELSTVTDDMREIPASWAWSSPGSMCEPDRIITYGVIKLGPPIEDGVPTLRSSDVRWLRIDGSNVKRISHEIADNYKRTYLRGGEILVTVRGTLGGVAVAPPEMAGWNVSREVAVIPLSQRLDAEYCMLSIGSMHSQRWLSGVAKGVAYTGVNIEDLRKLPLPVPPIAEQREIVRVASLLVTTADSLLARVDAASRGVERSAQAVLAKAFRGDLMGMASAAV
ncbi:MAG: restriction endonuclease subunit S [Phycisphaerae bacterium]|nr:restriction endonuclease subunit S [Phycisphaerae bacterium]